MTTDLAILVVAANRVVVDRLVAAQKARGLRVSPRHGFVIRAVFAEQPSITRLAKLLDTSKQAASKLADEMVGLGLLERFADPGDRRSTRLRLTAKGLGVRTRAVATSEALERELARAVGVQGVAALRRGLVALLQQNGALDEARAARARPVW